jgi:hypothetical protein
MAHSLDPPGFGDVSVTLEIREDVLESFDDYWSPIEGHRFVAAGLPPAFRGGPTGRSA